MDQRKTDLRPSGFAGMNYLILTREFPPLDGGIANVSLELARHLSQRGHIVKWLRPTGKEGRKINKEAATVFHWSRKSDRC